MHRPLSALVVSMLAISLSGCGKSAPPDRAVVTGKVTYQGKTIPHGWVTFVSKADAMMRDTVQIRADGSYASTNAPIGACKVILQINGAEDLQAIQARGEQPPPQLLPTELGKKYAFLESTPLEVTVELGEHVHDLEVK